ncbi:MAG: hypothetical protein NTX35_22475 [Verrucomicrobia bacterium]|nr:hypothetical protein [Verrucomicrobiota bacterium]
MIHAPHIIKLHRTRSNFLRRHLNASKCSLTANLGAALSGGTLDSADFFWLGYFDYPISSGIMESINKIGTPGYTDTHPLPAAVTTWKCRAIYRVDDAQVGQWSAVVSIAVGG